MLERLKSIIKWKGTPFIVILIVCAWIFYLPMKKFRDEGTVVGDSVLYFSYLQTVFEDGDFQFRDDYLELDPNLPKSFLQTTETGHTSNMFAPGAAILWSPFYLAGKAYVALAGISDRKEEIHILVKFVLVGTNFYGALTLLLSFLILKRFFPPYYALFGTLAAFFVTPFYSYAIYERINSHAVGAFAAALFIWLAVRSGPERKKRQWAIVGAAAGLIVLIRWMDIVVLSWLLVEQIPRLYKAIREKSRLSDLLPGYLIFTGVFALVLAPQIALLWILFGFFKGPINYGANIVLWNRPEIINILFSSRHGLFSAHPLIFLSVIGLILLLFKKRNIAIAALSVFLITAYVNSIIGDWWAGDAFGMRRFISVTPIFALGFAAFLHQFRKRYVVIALILVGFFFFGEWNSKMTRNYIVLDLPHDPSPDQSNPLGNFRQKYLNQFGYPVSWPWNIVTSAFLDFIPPEEADWIASTYLFSSHHNLEGIVAAKYPSFQHGFSPPMESEDGQTFRLLNEKGTVYVNLLASAGKRRMTIEGSLLDSNLKRGEVAVLEVFLNGRKVGYLAVPKRRMEKERTILFPPEFWKIGVNRIDLRLMVRERDLEDKKGKTATGTRERKVRFKRIKGYYKVEVFSLNFS